MNARASKEPQTEPEPGDLSGREMARCILAAAIAESLPFRVGVLGSTDQERRRWAGQVVAILERPHLGAALRTLAGAD